MPVEERRRIALHNHIAAAWGEEAADTLFELIAPAGRELATRDDVAGLRVEMERGFERIHQRFAAMEARLDARFEAVDGQFSALEDRMDGRFSALGERFERRIADAVTTQTRTLVLSQLGALVVIAGLAFGLQ